MRPMNTRFEPIFIHVEDKCGCADSRGEAVI